MHCLAQVKRDVLFVLAFSQHVSDNCRLPSTCVGSVYSQEPALEVYQATPRDDVSSTTMGTTTISCLK